jgi:hypothetical protein
VALVGGKGGKGGSKRPAGGSNDPTPPPPPKSAPTGGNAHFTRPVCVTSSSRGAANKYTRSLKPSLSPSPLLDKSSHTTEACAASKQPQAKKAGASLPPSDASVGDDQDCIDCDLGTACRWGHHTHFSKRNRNGYAGRKAEENRAAGKAAHEVGAIGSTKGKDAAVAPKPEVKQDSADSKPRWHHCRFQADECKDMACHGHLCTDAPPDEAEDMLYDSLIELAHQAEVGGFTKEEHLKRIAQIRKDYLALHGPEMTKIAFDAFELNCQAEDEEDQVLRDSVRPDFSLDTYMENLTENITDHPLLGGVRGEFTAAQKFELALQGAPFFVDGSTPDMFPLDFITTHMKPYTSIHVTQGHPDEGFIRNVIALNGVIWRHTKNSAEIVRQFRKSLKLPPLESDEVQHDEDEQKHEVRKEEAPRPPVPHSYAEFPSSPTGLGPPPTISLSAAEEEALRPVQPRINITVTPTDEEEGEEAIASNDTGTWRLPRPASWDETVYGDDLFNSEACLLQTQECYVFVREDATEGLHMARSARIKRWLVKRTPLGAHENRLPINQETTLTEVETRTVKESESFRWAWENLWENHTSQESFHIFHGVYTHATKLPVYHRIVQHFMSATGTMRATLMEDNETAKLRVTAELWIKQYFAAHPLTYAMDHRIVASTSAHMSNQLLIKGIRERSLKTGMEKCIPGLVSDPNTASAFGQTMFGRDLHGHETATELHKPALGPAKDFWGQHLRPVAEEEEVNLATLTALKQRQKQRKDRLADRHSFVNFREYVANVKGPKERWATSVATRDEKRAACLKARAHEPKPKPHGPWTRLNEWQQGKNDIWKATQAKYKNSWPPTSQHFRRRGPSKIASPQDPLFAVEPPIADQSTPSIIAIILASQL